MNHKLNVEGEKRVTRRREEGAIIVDRGDHVRIHISIFYESAVPAG